MSQDEKIKTFLESLITPRFLELVEKWSKYQGEDFSIGDADVHIENKGVFKTITTTPKFDIVNLPDGKFDIKFIEGETEDHETLYDVTLITNSCVCSDYNKRVLISERPDKYDKRPSKLWIYSIFEDENDDSSNYTKFPSFEKLKKDFESQSYTTYRSLLQEFCGVYSIIPFNDKTDRIFNFTGIENDLEWLEDSKEDWTEDAKKLQVTKRKQNKYKN